MARVQRPLSVLTAIIILGLGFALTFWSFLQSGLNTQNNLVHWVATAVYSLYGGLLYAVLQGKTWARNLLIAVLGLQLLFVAGLVAVVGAAVPVQAGIVFALVCGVNGLLAYCLLNKKAADWFAAVSEQRKE